VCGDAEQGWHWHCEDLDLEGGIVLDYCHCCADCISLCTCVLRAVRVDLVLLQESAVWEQQDEKVFGGGGGICGGDYV
jgi:hypothetical protein